MTDIALAAWAVCMTVWVVRLEFGNRRIVTVVNDLIESQCDQISINRNMMLSVESLSRDLNARREWAAKTAVNWHAKQPR